MYKGYNSENSSGKMYGKDYSQEQPGRATDAAEKYLRQKAETERKRELEKIYGDRTQINIGALDRVQGNAYGTSKQGEIDNGYKYGYYTKGNIAIMLLLSCGGYCNFAPVDLESAISNIAMNDAKNPEIDFTELPERIRENQMYAKYYNNASMTRNTR